MKITVLVPIVVLVFLAASLTVTAYYTVFETPVTNEYNGTNEKPSIAVHGSNVYVVWNNRPHEFKSIIYFQKSSDHGNTWTDKVNFTDLNSSAAYPEIVLTNTDDLHVIWRDFRHINPEIYYKRSLDGGETWEPAQRLTFNNTIYSNRFDLNLAASGQHIYAVWKEYEVHPTELFFMHSSDNGASWSQPRRITFDFNPSYYPVMTVADDIVYVLWEDWGSDANIVFIRSTDQGNTWSEPIQISNTGVNNNLHADIAASQNNVCCVWQEKHNGIWNTYFKTSSDYGETWSAPQMVSRVNISSYTPQIVVYHDMVGVLWREIAANFSIYYRESNDTGTTWSNETVLTADAEYEIRDVKAINQGTHLYTVSRKNFDVVNSEVYFLHRHDENPVLTVLTVSKSTITIPDVIQVTVSGIDPIYTQSELTCLVQYRSFNTSWLAVDVTLNDDHWVGMLTFTNDSIRGVYQMQAQLRNPAGYTSEWVQCSDIIVSKAVTPEQTSGFGSIVLFSALFILYGSLRRRKTLWKND